MPKHIIAALGTTLLLTACATVETAETTETVQTASAENVVKPQTFSSTVVDGDGVICKYRDVTGSNFRRKMCGTAEEWAAIEEEARKAVEKVQRRNRGFEPPNR
ncbi:hypothetical protein ACFFUB_14165 [Algimonas porphyrae]|uniref:Lipoprotein n=1 Tax=Algimonas porphyrae TaxID=1128113 RepID=A0ABQ5UYV5_9PROT|nr:hypothetical protein [Algimonas porphyrae]GLQ19565.1 hypothetical protein GCM10007854_05200 [Algimonas porphyrae]